jgi:hypothetical protein
MSDGSDLGGDTPTQTDSGSTTSFKGAEAAGGTDKATPASPPSDSPGDHDAGGSMDIGGLGGLLGGSDSSVSNPIGIGPGKGDAFLDVGVGGKGGLNVNLDGNEHAGVNLNADLSGHGLKIGIDGGDKGDGALIGVGRLADLAGLVGDHGSLIDVDFGQDDGHTAALLDVIASGDADAHAAVLGSDIIASGGLDILGSSGLLDGVLDDCSLLG